MTTSIARALNEVATRWQIDAAHSNIEFGVRHLMISTVKGRFSDVAGTVTVDPDDPTAVGVDVTLKTASIDTRQEQRDAHLRSADFFDAETHPTIAFRSTSIEQASAPRWKLTVRAPATSTSARESRCCPWCCCRWSRRRAASTRPRTRSDAG